MAALVALPAVLTPSPAGATLQATGTGTHEAATGSWGAVFTSSSLLGGATGALSTALTGDSYPFLTNVGTAELGGRFDVTLTITATGGASATLEICSGTWNQVLGSCSGTATTLAATGAPGTVDGALVDVPGDAVRLRLHPGVGSAGQTATLSVAVAPR